LGASKAALEAQVTALERNLANTIARMNAAQSNVSKAQTELRETDERREKILRDARLEAGTIVAAARQQAQEILNAARARVSAALKYLEVEAA
jgi:ElaB/YqjD/DUF883 family membrane-anchored ribosome-binding protein